MLSNELTAHPASTLQFTRCFPMCHFTCAYRQPLVSQASPPHFPDGDTEAQSNHMTHAQSQVRILGLTSPSHILTSIPSHSHGGLWV